MKILKCAYSECNKEFTPQTHNQKYCCDVCCRVATNLKIKEKYYENKERLRGKKRYCFNHGCNNLLSRYNTEKYCQECVGQAETKKRNSLLRMIKDVSG
jgi:1-aminocyclopropane-1-carboxylate deaminase/D-cysteine desulfhydrase-like pyridoxal-dependent ACC family enzyme